MKTFFIIAIIAAGLAGGFIIKSNKNAKQSVKTEALAVSAVTEVASTNPGGVLPSEEMIQPQLGDETTAISTQRVNAKRRYKIRTLKQAYKNYFPIGAAVRTEEDFTSPQKVEFIKKQFASLTGKQAMQPGWIHPKEHVYRWAKADSLAAFAKENNLLLRGHCLIWDLKMPKWFLKDGDAPASKEVVLNRMKTHINTVMSRYKGAVYCWDVVNEANRAGDQLYKLLGEEYIEKAFEYAREADPSAKLYYNDGVYSVGQRTKFYNLIKRLKAKGVPIDGMGIQYHLGIEGTTKQTIQQDIDAYRSLGLDVQITELDVSVFNRKATVQGVKLLKDSYSKIDEQKQALTYRDIFDVLRKNKDVIKGVTLWGLGDGSSFWEKKLEKKNYPYLFNQNLIPKKGYYDITNF